MSSTHKAQFSRRGQSSVAGLCEADGGSEASGGNRAEVIDPGDSAAAATRSLLQTALLQVTTLVVKLSTTVVDAFAPGADFMSEPIAFAASVRGADGNHECGLESGRGHGCGRLESLGSRRKVARSTVLTMLERLQEKGWLTCDEEGHAFRYRAAVPREATLGEMVRRLVDTAFGGSAKGLVMALLHDRGVSKEEAKRIKRMIDRGGQDIMNVLARFDPGDAAAGLVLVVLLQTSAVIGLAAIVSRVMFRWRAEARHVLWLGALGFVVISPVVAIVVSRTGISLWAVTLPVAIERPTPLDGGFRPSREVSRSESSRLHNAPVVGETEPPGETTVPTKIEPARFEA